MLFLLDSVLPQQRAELAMQEFGVLAAVDALFAQRFGQNIERRARCVLGARDKVDETVFRFPDRRSSHRGVRSILKECTCIGLD